MGNIVNETTMIYSENDSVEKNKKEKEYLDYINEHINNVKKAYEMYLIPLLDMETIPCTLVSTEELKRSIESCKSRIDNHDASKFGDDEFDGYRIKYHPTEKEKLDPKWEKYSEELFDKCWEHHYTVNDHHPEHWVDKETKVVKDMTLDAIMEMICDWEAMSMKFKDIIEWYRSNGCKKEYSASTKAIVEDLLFNVIHNTKS